MLMKLARTLGTATTALIMAGVTQAVAEPKLKEARFFGSPDNAPEVRVGAENGRWVIIKSPGITYKFNYYVKANRKLRFIYVSNMTVPAVSGEAPWVRGDISADGKQRTAWGEGAFFLPNGRIGNDSGKLKAACNDLISQGKTTTSQGGETYATLQLTARVAVGDYGDGPQFGRLSGTTMVKVICEPEPSKIQAPPKPFSVDVKVEQKGETCPKQTDVTAIIKYRRKATARFRFKVDGKLSKVHEIKARKVSGGKPPPPGVGGPGAGTYYLVERLKTYHLDPGQHHFRVVMEGGKDKKSAVITRRVKCPPFKITSTTLTYKVAKKLTCKKKVAERLTANATRPGKAKFVIKTQAGAVVHSGTAEFKRQGMKYVATSKRPNLLMGAYDADMMADFTKHAANSGWIRLRVDCMEALSGTLEQRRFAADRCEGEAAFSIRTNGPGKVPYRLECTGGRAWTGKVQAHETGPDTFIGVDTVRFDVSNNELVRCALRTRKPLPFKVLAGDKRTYECHKPTDVSGSDDLAPETRPDSHDPRAPVVVIDPPRPSDDSGGPGKTIDPGPQISCAGGVVKKDECLCPRTHKVVAAGKNAFRCVRTAVIDPVKSDQGGKTTDATPDYGKKTRHDAEADRRRLEALRKRQEAKKRAEAVRRKKAKERAAKLRRKREAAKKAAELRRQRQAAKKAAELRRKRKAAAARRKRKKARQGQPAQ